MQFDLKGPRFPYTCRHTGNYVKTCEDVVLVRRADWNLFQLGPVAQQRRPKFFFPLWGDYVTLLRRGPR